MRHRFLTSLVLLMMACGCLAQSAEELRVQTRFGALTLDHKGRLLFRSKLIQPVMQANSGIDFGKPFHMGASDVVLVTIIGGTACPYRYHFVTVTQSGAKATPEFGTCNESLLAERQGDAISLTMHDYRGPFEPEAERNAAFKRTVVFVFRDGVVLQDGKPVK
jgi:hypothetical protein